MDFISVEMAFVEGSVEGDLDVFVGDSSVRVISI